MNDTERAERRAAGLARQQADRVAAEEKRRDIEFRRRTSRDLTDIHYLRYVHFSEERTSRRDRALLGSLRALFGFRARSRPPLLQ